MSDKLLPCPFCGSEAELTEIGNAVTKSRKAKIKCTNSFCSAEIIKATIKHDMDWVVRLTTSYWNTRHESEKTGVEDYRDMVEKILVPNGYKTVHIGNPLEVSASQFLYKSQVEHLISELNLYAQSVSADDVMKIIDKFRTGRADIQMTDDCFNDLTTALQKLLEK